MYVPWIFQHCSKDNQLGYLFIRVLTKLTLSPSFSLLHPAFPETDQVLPTQVPLYYFVFQYPSPYHTFTVLILKHPSGLSSNDTYSVRVLQLPKHLRLALSYVF